MKKLDILAFGAHPDDVELACAGTVIKHVDAGMRVGIVDLTQGEMGSRGTIETRYDEAADASKIMGISERVNLKMEDGLFEINEANKRLIVEQVRRFQPNIVLANAVDDRHPDHGRGAQLVSEACFLAGLIQFETTWNGEVQEAFRPKVVYHYIQDRYIKPDFVVDVTAVAERKMEAIKAYKTQFFQPDQDGPKTPISGADFMDFIWGRMHEMGRQAGFTCGEGFTVERFPGVQLLTDLK
ncbi:MAG: bacillithiol biosynthesis deacetylase BshB1 [bacterium]|nr:bacillithiol biosynthesis deacetylase BshB1 [bacterium]